MLLFLFEVYFAGRAPKMYINQLKGICNTVHFLTKLQVEGPLLYQKYATMLVLSKSFAQICSFLKRVSQNFTNFPENLLVATFSGRRLQSGKT